MESQSLFGLLLFSMILASYLHIYTNTSELWWGYALCNRWCKWHYLNRMAWLYRSLSLFFLTSTSCKHKLRVERRPRPASPVASRPRCTGGSRHRSRPSEEPPPAAASPHGIGPPDSNISRNYAKLYHLQNLMSNLLEHKIGHHVWT